MGVPYRITIAGRRLEVCGDDGLAAVAPALSGVVDPGGGAPHAALEIQTGSDPAGRLPWRGHADGAHHYEGGALAVSAGTAAGTAAGGSGSGGSSSSSRKKELMASAHGCILVALQLLNTMAKTAAAAREGRVASPLSSPCSRRLSTSCSWLA